MMNNYIFEYYQAISDGSIVTGKWIQILFKRIKDEIESKEYIFDQKKADRAITWIEKHARHTEGPLAPNRITLELWQKAFLSCMFGLCDPKTGYRQFREVVLIVARKNGKSLFASAIANYTFFLDGGFGARIYCLAPKLDQADIIYNSAWAQIQLDPELVYDKENPDKPNAAKHRMTDLFIADTNSTIKKIAFSAKKSDGFNPSLTICDEIASWSGDKGLKQYEVMKSGMGARPEGLLLSCSTSGYENDSIYDELMKRSTRFLLGESKETRLLPFLYMIDDIEKWNDINELRKSNPNLGVSVPVDYLIEEIAVAEGSLSKRAEFITKYCNIKQNSTQAFLAAQDVEKAYGEPLRLEDFRGCYCCCGLDLSQVRDLTACTCVIEKNGILHVFAHAFMPGELIEEATARDGVPYNIYIQRGLLSPSGDNFVDYHDCYNWFVDLVEKYELYPLWVGYDRYSAQYLIKDMEAYGFHCDDVFQGENLYPVLMEFEGLLKDGKIRIGDNDLLKMHMLDSALKMSIERGRGKLVKLTGKSHIDLFASLIDSLTVRQKWYGEIGEQLRNGEEENGDV